MSSAARISLLIVFGASGCSALMYQLVWSRQMQLYLGSTLHTASAVIATFLLGFSIGSYATRKWADRTDQPILYLSVIQILLAIYGVLLLFVLPVLPGLYLQLPDSVATRAVVCALLLIIPTSCFGSVWPYCNRAYVRDLEHRGRGTGALYAANSIGSALGALLAGFFLVKTFGFLATACVAAGLNLAAGALCFAVGRHEQH